MDTNKKQIETAEDFHMAMSAVRSAMELLSTFDWQHLLDQSNFFEGAGTVIDPTVFIQMQKDPQWEQKKRLFKAAADFTAHLGDIRRQLDAG